ncbi:glycine betaine ABC transporter substrate-binding protein [Cupriavidus oxalaticus]|uniref:glycine betaine ABC transporter substrate-binding protein n=1 Tax=Cupriavidus oxalaticus TaxID=96344 RepID=UPI0031767E29
MLATALVGTQPAQAADPLRVGSKRFTESYILGELLTQAAGPPGAAQHQQGLGNTAIVFEALKAGSIDLYPDYTGTLAAEILKLQPGASLDAIQRALAPLGLGATIPLGFENTYALAVSDTRPPHLRRLSDLAAQPRLRLGLSHEFLGRADGWPGLASRYRLPQQPVGLDHGVAYEALAAGQVDAIDIYSTDAKILKYRLRVLEDDRRYFPRYDAVVVYRLDVPQRFPQAWQALQRLSGRISAADMVAMNAAAEIDRKPFDLVAREFLANGPNPGTEPVAARTPAAAVAAVAGAAAAAGASDRRLLGALLGPDTNRLARRHIGLVVGAVGAATLAGVPLGILAARRRRTGQVVLGAVSVLQTVPSLALLAMLIPLLGRIGVWPALVALFLYALLPIVRNTATGLEQVPPGMRDAARALGLRGGQVLRYVELPLALPVLLAGVKTAAIISVGTATIAAFVGAGGFGERIATGLALNDTTLLLAGAIPAAVLALAVQAAFEMLEWALRRHRDAR